MAINTSLHHLLNNYNYSSRYHVTTQPNKNVSRIHLLLPMFLSTIGIVFSLELLCASIHVVPLPIGIIIFSVSATIFLISILGLCAHTHKAKIALQTPHQTVPASSEKAHLQEEDPGELCNLIADKYAIETLSYVTPAAYSIRDYQTKFTHKQLPVTLIFHDSTFSLKSCLLHKGAARVFIVNDQSKIQQQGHPEGVLDLPTSIKKECLYRSLYSILAKDKLYAWKIDIPEDNLYDEDPEEVMGTLGAYIFGYNLASRSSCIPLEENITSSQQVEELFVDLVQLNAKMLSFGADKGVFEIHLQELLGTNMCSKNHPQRKLWEDMCLLALLYAIETESQKSTIVSTIYINALRKPRR